MKQNKLKMSALLLVFAMILTLFAGCGNDAVSESVSASDVVSLSEQVPDLTPDAAVEPASVEEGSSAEPGGNAAAIDAEVSFSEQVKLAATGGATKELMEFEYAEETQLPITDEDITFSYFFSTQPFMMAYGGEVDYNALTFYQEWQNRTGIKLDMTAVSLMSVTEQFQLMIASGDYADLIDGMDSYTGGADAAIDDDVIYELTDIAAEYMPNYSAWLDSDHNYKKTASTVSGNLYNCAYLSYGALTVGLGGIINQDWLDEAGMDVPVTYDDMHDVLTAFKENGHGGALWMTSGLDTAYHTYTAGYEVADTGFLNVDGTIKCTYVDDDMLDYVTMMNQWYKEGLIYQDFITIDTTSDTIDSGLVTGGTVGVYSGAFDTAQTMMADSGITLTPFSNLRKEADQTIHVTAQSTYDKGGTAISTSVSESELPIAAQMLDYLYSKDGVILSNFGVEGEALAYDEEGLPQLSDLVLNNPELPMAVVGIVLYTKYGGAGINFVPREYAAYDDAYWNACSVWVENTDNDYMLPFHSILNAEETVEYDNAMSDIQTVIDENLLKFVLGDRPLDQWDDYVDTLYSLGLQNVIDLYQGALDRYLA